MKNTGLKPGVSYDPYNDATAFWTDGQMVYYRLQAIKGASVEAFRHFPGWWATDGKHCYIQSTRLQQADVASFTPLNFAFAKDKATVWTLAGSIAGADAKSFEVCDRGMLSQGTMLRTLSSGDKIAYERFVPYGFAKDKNQVYYYDFQGKAKIVKKADPLSFRSLHDGHFGLDALHVFCGSHILPKATAATWQKLEECYFYSRDGIHIYYLNRLVKGADAATFEVEKDPNPLGTPRQSAKDKHHTYHNDVSTKTL